MAWPTGPWNQAIWDMNVCHTWYAVGYGKGNVPMKGGVPSSVWDGDNPPPPNPPPAVPPLWVP
jgi:hypothetical protein